MSATLLLNSDGNPVSILPLSTISWKKSILYMLDETATVLEWYDNWIVHSVNWQTAVPAVMILKNYERKRHQVRFSKRNVFLRDGFRCQYCGQDVSKKSATMDHILPISHGGKSTYENCVCACDVCNAQKGNNKAIRPKKMPIKPSYYQLVEQRKKLPFEGGHHTWPTYLGIKEPIEF